MFKKEMKKNLNDKKMLGKNAECKKKNSGWREVAG